jgi:hypothetical protein
MKKKLKLADVIQMLRDEVIAEGGLRKLSEKAGVSASYLSDVANGFREPGPKICEYLKIRKVRLYEKIHPGQEELPE